MKEFDIYLNYDWRWSFNYIEDKLPKSYPKQTVMESSKITQQADKKLTKFYRKEIDEFWLYHTRKDFYNQSVFKIENTRIKSLVSDKLSKLNSDWTCFFKATINKYRDILNRSIKDWMFCYSYIDTFWNPKDRNESLFSFLSYNTKTPPRKEDCSTEHEFKVTISNRLEDKLELLEHEWFNGSCQHWSNSNEWSNAHGYYNMFNNWWIYVVKFHEWDKFVWRLLLRTYLDTTKDKEYIVIDRLYRVGNLAQIESTKLHTKIADYLCSLGMNVLLAREPDYYLWVKTRIPSVVLTSPAYQTHPEIKQSYYNNIHQWTVLTKDWYLVDVLKSADTNVYFYNPKDGTS